MNNRPNILLLMTDQQRFNSLGCYGGEAVKTPNLDRLASQGVRFENCYVNNPICTPSRASLLTGKELPGHKVYQLNDNLPDDQVLFPERLREIGYTTAIFGKLHVCGIEYEVNKKHPHHGFDVYGMGHDQIKRFHGRELFNAYADWLRTNHSEYYNKALNYADNKDPVPEAVHFNHWAAEKTIDFIKERDKAKPFFCLTSIIAPHNPYTNHPSTAMNTVRHDKIPKPHSVNNNMTQEYTKIQMDAANVANERYGYDVQKMRESYFASIGYADIEYGRILEELKQEGILDDTLIIFISDHGDMLGDHGLFVKGASFYEECVKVPFIIRYPKKIKPNTVSSIFVQPHDIAATILAEAGYDRNELAEIMPTSCNLMPFLTGEKAESACRDYAICMFRTSGVMRQELMLQRYLQYQFDINQNGTKPDRMKPPYFATMIRHRQYKAMVFHNMNVADADVHGELYDMENDPKEQNNLWNDSAYEKIKLNMLLRLMNWMVKTDYLSYKPESNEENKGIALV